MKKYEAHPLAELFPPMDADDKAKLTESIKTNGQLEPIILFEDKILDGFNRFQVLTDLGIEPRYAPWENLTPAARAAGPLNYVISRNLARRHLTASQKGIIAAEMLPLFEAEAKARQSTALPAKSSSAPNGAKVTPGDEMNQDPGHDAASESQAPARKKAGASKGKAVAAAAKAVGTSPSQVERGKKLLKKTPKKAAAVKAGKLSLNKATKDVSKEAAAKAKLEEAYTRITKVCGRNFGAAARDKTVLKGGKKEVIEFAGMSDADMTKCQGLLERGWPLKKTRAYKMTALTPKNTLRDLCIRALSQGVAKEGSFAITMTAEDVSLEITVKASKK